MFQILDDRHDKKTTLEENKLMNFEIKKCIRRKQINEIWNCSYNFHTRVETTNFFNYPGKLVEKNTYSASILNTAVI